MVQGHNSLSHARISSHLNPSQAKRVPIQNKQMRSHSFILIQQQKLPFLLPKLLISGLNLTL